MLQVLIRYIKVIGLGAAIFFVVAPMEKTEAAPFFKVKRKMTLETALKQIPKAYGVDELVARVLVEKESGGNINAFRFEPSQMKRAAKFTKDKGRQKMLSSSHGPMQVMGYNAEAMGVDWSDLYNPEVGVELGMHYWARCQEKCTPKYSRYECIYATALCYNGSKSYADDFLVRLSKKLIERENI